MACMSLDTMRNKPEVSANVNCRPLTNICDNRRLTIVHHLHILLHRWTREAECPEEIITLPDV